MGWPGWWLGRRPGSPALTACRCWPASLKHSQGSALAANQAGQRSGQPTSLTTWCAAEQHVARCCGKLDNTIWPTCHRSHTRPAAAHWLNKAFSGPQAAQWGRQPPEPWPRWNGGLHEPCMGPLAGTGFEWQPRFSWSSHRQQGQCFLLLPAPVHAASTRCKRRGGIAAAFA